MNNNNFMLSTIIHNNFIFLQNLRPLARHHKHDKQIPKLNRAIGKLYEMENQIQKLAVKFDDQNGFDGVEKSIQEIIDNLNEFSTSHRKASLTQHTRITLIIIYVRIFFLRC